MCHPNDSPNVTHKHFYPRPHSHVTLTLGLSPLTNFCFPSCLRRCFRNSSRITDFSCTHKFPRNSIFLWQPPPSPPPGSSWSFPSWVGVCVRVCVCVCSSGNEEGCCQSNRLNRFRDSNQKKGTKVLEEVGLACGFSRCHSTGSFLRGKCRAAAVERPLEMLRFMGRPQHWM